MVANAPKILSATAWPRAKSPAKRLAAVRALNEAGVPTGVMAAPMIPVLTDSEMEAILEASAEAGASAAGYVLLRLPLEIKDLFREWLATDMAKAFMRAYRKTRLYMNEAPAAEIAKAEKPYFPDIDEDVLATCIDAYQKLGTWTPHAEITKPGFEVILDVFAHFGTLKERYAYEQVCVLPPEG